MEIGVDLEIGVFTKMTTVYEENYFDVYIFVPKI